MLNFWEILGLKIATVLMPFLIAIGLIKGPDFPILPNLPPPNLIEVSASTTVPDLWDQPPAPDLPERSSAKPVEKIIEEPTEPVAPIIPPATDPTPTKPIEPKFTFRELDTKAREAVINIFCTTKSGGDFKPISGTGVIVNQDGLVLSVAHIGQYFLLKDFQVKDFITCFGRAGSPAKNRYLLEPIYISGDWIADNVKDITKTDPTGTGEDDFAIFRITDTADWAKPLPANFTYFEPAEPNSSPEINQNILVVGYPAGLIGGIETLLSLPLVSSIVTINDIYTFEKGSDDLISLGGSIVAQKGSSGGAVIGENGKLLGIVVTSSITETTTDRSLMAITISHVRDSLKRQTGRDLETVLAPGKKESAILFNQFELSLRDDLRNLLINQINAPKN